MFVATLFDYNGVLVDDESVHLNAFREVLATLGVTFSDEDYWERYIGFDDVGAFSAILRDAGRETSETLIRELIEKKRPVYMQSARAGLRVFPGAADRVKQARQSGPVGVVSGALRDEIELGLGLLGVREEIAFVISAEDTRHGKPHPEGYERGFSEIARRVDAATRHATLVIEDSLAGVSAAKGAGLATIGVAHSYTADELTKAGADAVIACIDELEVGLVRALYEKLHA